MKEWAAIASSGAFEAAKVHAYLDSVEDRMDLFHPTRPFAQTRGLLAQFSDYLTPIDELEVARARWGGARELFQHRPASISPSMSPRRAARALLAYHAFATGGLVRKPGEPTAATAAPLVRGAVIVVRGRTLFETLAANLLKYGDSEPVPTGGARDACAWEQEPPPTELRLSSEPKYPPLGYLDLLTRLSRRVELVHDEGTVTHFVNAVWQGLPDAAPRDPMLAYRRHEKLGWLPIGVDVDRAFWRSSAALFEAARSDSSAFERPHAIDLVASNEAVETLGSVTFDIEVLGMAAEKSRIDAVRAERVQAQGRCFNDPEAASAVREAIRVAEQSVSSLSAALFRYARVALAPGERDPATDDVRALADSFGAAPAAWSGLGVVFDHFMRRLADDPQDALEEFQREATRVVTGVFHNATERTETTGRWLKARALAEQSFRAALSRLTASTTPASTVGDSLT
ncbi:MAG: type I-E CRISPR-associated protein Cse1/CasA [Acidobacteria bacterium SCN 69-37]|nr:MAG: type I-E CRISPR-associated protein Cse1/CasA [Acidobacteria bacterium SCN 69-37]